MRIVPEESPPLIALALAVLVSQPWEYDAPAAVAPPPPAVEAAGPVEGATPTPRWSDLVEPLARSEAMSHEALVSGLLPRVEAFLDADPDAHAANLARIVEALGPNAALLAGRVGDELARDPADPTDASGLRALGRAAAADHGLALSLLAAWPKGEPEIKPGTEAFGRGLLDPPFPIDRDPPACHAGDLLNPAVPGWGESEAVDARLTELLVSCPSVDVAALRRGLLDGRDTVRSAALSGWASALRDGRANFVGEPGAVADDILRMLSEHGLPPRQPGDTHGPADAVAASLVPAELAEHGLAALGNAGRPDEMRELTRAIEAARAPRGIARSIHDLTR